MTNRKDYDSWQRFYSDFCPGSVPKKTEQRHKDAVNSVLGSLEDTQRTIMIHRYGFLTGKPLPIEDIARLFEREGRFIRYQDLRQLETQAKLALFKSRAREVLEEVHAV